METGKLIPAGDFCHHHQIEISFLYSLENFGLISMTTRDDMVFLDTEQLLELEKIIRLHFDLDINLEGIDVINHLLKRMEEMQGELSQLKNRLRLYEHE